MADSQRVHDLATRPLVVRFGSMGDMVIVLALIHALHRRFGAPVDVVSSGSWTRPLLESQPAVGNLYLIRSRKIPYLFSPRQRQLVRALRERGATPTWICHTDAKSHWFVARAGIPDWYVVDARSCPRLPREHAVDRWLRFAQASPPALDNADVRPVDYSALRAPPLLVHESWRSELSTWLHARGLADRKIVLVQAGNRRTARWGRPRRRPTNTKYWPEDRWALVIDTVAKLEPDAEILLTGVPAESALNEAILERTTTNRVRNIARDLQMHRLLALQERAVGMISVDTGPAHSAAALSCPLVVLFGVADPCLYAPRSPSGAVVCLQGRQEGRPSMLGISSDEVIGAWRGVRQLSSAAPEHLRQPPTPKLTSSLRAWPPS